MRLFSLPKKGSAMLSHGHGKVILAEDLEQIVCAKQLVVEAEASAEQRIKDAEAECVVLKEMAYQKGYQDGLAMFNGHILACEGFKRKVELDLEQKLFPLAIQMARKLVGALAEQHPEIVVDVVKKGLEPVLQHYRFEILINKNDKEILESKKTEIKALLERAEIFNFVVSEDVPPGGCIIQTESGIINATFESQWAAFDEALRQNQAALSEITNQPAVNS